MRSGSRSAINSVTSMDADVAGYGKGEGGKGGPVEGREGGREREGVRLGYLKGGGESSGGRERRGGREKREERGSRGERERGLHGGDFGCPIHLIRKGTLRGGRGRVCALWPAPIAR